MGRKRLSTSEAKRSGQKGGLKGGPARARTLTRSQRQEIAAKGGKAKASKAQTTTIKKPSKTGAVTPKK